MKVPLKVRSPLSIVLSLILGAASYAVVRHFLVSASGENAESTARTYQFRNPESVKSGRGHFRIAGTSRNPGDRRAVTEGAQFAVRLPALVANLNSWISLPRNLEIRSEKCGQADAYYDDAAGNIVVCSELEDQFYNYFLSKRSTPEQARNAALRAMKLVFFHEVGHAVIGMWDLPSTGREEDAADQFAVLTALKADPDGDHTIYDGANSLKMYIDRAKKTDQPIPKWDEHSPDDQRLSASLCLLYGSNPSRFSYLVKSGDLPAHRTTACTVEYQRVDGAWNSLLAPFLKDPNEGGE